MSFLQSETLTTFGGVVHGFADRNIGANSSAIENQFDLSKVAQLKQVHSGDVIIVEDVENHDDLTEADALITALKGFAVAVRTADCVPILIVDKGQTVVAAVHAGWRGTWSEIAVNTVNKIESEFGIGSGNLTAVIGPSIKNCCYEVEQDVSSLFKERFDNTSQYLSNKGHSKYLLDLSIANRIQLQAAGVGKVEILNICTKCDNRFYSYRREGKGVSTQLSFIALT